VKDILKGKANIIYPANVQASVTVPIWCQWVIQHPPPNGGKWDVIHFNWGLWDVSHDWRLDDHNQLSGKAGTTPAEYEKNLRTAVQILKTTGAKLIFATTTPLGPAKVNKYDSVPERNDIAKRIMRENGIPIDDLYSKLSPDEADLLLPDGIHQNQKGNEILAKSVAESIELQLPKK
jgi:acyl-CoA thioesterase-1